MIKVTLDTNILVSATFWTGDSFKILNLIDQDKIKCALSKERIFEYNKTICSDEIQDKVENKCLILSKVVQKVINQIEMVEPHQKLSIVEDPDDNMILECAKAGRVDFIVTNDNVFV